MIGIVDLHCHILPYVDDGALREGESIELLDILYRQGVRTICATPHLRKGMFETADKDIWERFQKLKKHIDSAGMDLSLFLSREYHCDEVFFERLEQGRLIPMGDKNLLVEFSHSHSYKDIHEHIQTIVDNGYVPLIAHAERYPALRKDTDQIRELIECGARIQVNIGSILGREGFRQSLWCKKLLKEHLVYVVASDAHDPIDRPPEWDKCLKALKKQTDADYIERITKINAQELLRSTEGE